MRKSPVMVESEKSRPPLPGKTKEMTERERGGGRDSFDY